MKRVSYAVMTVLMTATVLTTGCNLTNPKVAECNRLIKVANTAKTKASALNFIGKTSTNKTQVAKKMVDLMRKSSKEIKTVSLKDSKLQLFQTRLASMYYNTSSINSSMLNAAQHRDFRRMTNLFKKMTKQLKQERKLVKDINSYCRAS
ncbi:hypothetical protein IQ266_06025 [filamentous cyanobacterium LEGE 11480]|uniref:Lipoprotein n=1 Tax=Romeriopsis navalis LEGE 11480 TaxID=2777977 RepID=A0A928VNV1_9CYAN|nr:hypothetical protein [Romeriopsis navalis]MBE9029319.1 hypothetical protein [Romeriopsis navalis LEGE 11480]